MSKRRKISFPATAVWFGTIVVWGLTCSACSKEKPTAADTTPPAPISGLTAQVTGSDTVVLSWTASGDDGNSGRAAQYDLRFARESLTEKSFLSATRLPEGRAPLDAGQPESYSAIDLPGATALSFGIRVRDEAGNWSPPAIVGPVTTEADTIPPAIISHFRLSTTGDKSLTLAWTSSGDDSVRGRVDHYDLRYSGIPITAQNWPQAHPAVFNPEIKPGGAEQTGEVTGLPYRRALYLAMAAVDESGNRSPLTPALSFALTGGPRSWRILPDRLGDAPTIQAGIDSAIAADSVLVGPGTYYENIDFKGKPITVLSTHGPDLTIIDANGVGSCVKFVTQESRASVLQGLTLTHGGGQMSSRTGQAKHGGGIFCEDGSPTIRRNVIRENTLTDRGSGAGGYFGNPFRDSAVANPKLEDNHFEGNIASEFGGGCAIVNCDAVLISNKFSNNSAQKYDGGGVWCWKTGAIQVQQCLFVNNVTGDHGGALELAGDPNSTATIRHNLFLRNIAHGLDSPDIQRGAGGGISVRGSAGDISNNTFVGNDGDALHGPSGGALLIAESDNAVNIFDNIIAGSRGYGIACFEVSAGALHDNLLWDNSPSDFGSDTLACTSLLAANVHADPIFCDPTAMDFRVAANSPAIQNAIVKGAFLETCSAVSFAAGAPSPTLARTLVGSVQSERGMGASAMASRRKR